MMHYILRKLIVLIPTTIVVLYISSFQCFAQSAPTVTFQHCFGGTKEDILPRDFYLVGTAQSSNSSSDVVSGPGNTFTILGFTNSTDGDCIRNSSGLYYNSWVAQIDVFGDTLSTSVFPGALNGGIRTKD